MPAIPPPTTISPVRSARIVLVFDRESKTWATVYQRFRPSGENVRSGTCDSVRRPAGASRRTAGAALGAGQGSLRRLLVAPGRLPRPWRDAGGVDPAPSGGQGRRSRALPPRAAA